MSIAINNYLFSFNSIMFIYIYFTNLENEYQKLLHLSRKDLITRLYWNCILSLLFIIPYMLINFVPSLPNDDQTCENSIFLNIIHLKHNYKKESVVRNRTSQLINPKLNFIPNIKFTQSKILYFLPLILILKWTVPFTSHQ